jgi:4-hydroxy-3-methylbut-2-enyl diphosphate reductase
MIVEIDSSSGFCFGVNNAIEMAEEELKKGFVCSLGEIVHNHEEVSRLETMGMKTVSARDIVSLKGKKILIRTHGEPPETYALLEQNEVLIIDATCPIVKKLQIRIKKSSEAARGRISQVLIYGKKDHAEVIGLVGHSGNFAKVIENEDDLKDVDFARPVELYVQTTMTQEGLKILTDVMKEKILRLHGNPEELLRVYNTICGHVSGRDKSLRIFASSHDVILFVSGKNSSNGNRLFRYCKEENPNSYFISHPSEVNIDWFKGIKSIGISGATSTPAWLMSQIKDELEARLNL